MWLQEVSSNGSANTWKQYLQHPIQETGLWFLVVQKTVTPEWLSTCWIRQTYNFAILKLPADILLCCCYSISADTKKEVWVVLHPLVFFQLHPRIPSMVFVFSWYYLQTVKVSLFSRSLSKQVFYLPWLDKAGYRKGHPLFLHVTWCLLKLVASWIIMVHDVYDCFIISSSCTAQGNVKNPRLDWNINDLTPDCLLLERVRH